MNSKYDLEGNGLKGQMATSPTQNFSLHYVQTQKIAQSLNVQSKFTPLHTSSSFLAVAQYSMEDFIRVWASNSDKTAWEHPTHPVAIHHQSSPSSLYALHYSTHWTRQQSLNHHSSPPSSLSSIYCSLLQAKMTTCTFDIQRSQSLRPQLFLHFTSQQRSLSLLLPLSISCHIP
jgi:hypothetical protein